MALYINQLAFKIIFLLSQYLLCESLLDKQVIF